MATRKAKKEAQPVENPAVQALLNLGYTQEQIDILLSVKPIKAEPAIATETPEVEETEVEMTEVVDCGGDDDLAHISQEAFISAYPGDVTMTLQAEDYDVDTSNNRRHALDEAGLLIIDKNVENGYLHREYKRSKQRIPANLDDMRCNLYAIKVWIQKVVVNNFMGLGTGNANKVMDKLLAIRYSFTVLEVPYTIERSGWVVTVCFGIVQALVDGKPCLVSVRPYFNKAQKEEESFYNRFEILATDCTDINAKIAKEFGIPTDTPADSEEVLFGIFGKTIGIRVAKTQMSTVEYSLLIAMKKTFENLPQNEYTEAILGAIREQIANEQYTKTTVVTSTKKVEEPKKGGSWRDVVALRKLHGNQ